MGKSILDILLENQDTYDSVSDMRKVLGAEKTKIPGPILKIKPLLLSKGEYELYEFLDYCEWWKVTNRGAPGWNNTAGVRAASGKVEFYYDEEFIKDISKRAGELMFLIAHEASHILRLHADRTSAAGHKPDKSNIAQDMIINNDILKTSEIGGFKPQLAKIIDPETGKETGKPFVVPDKFHKEFKNKKEAYYYENMYKWLEQNEWDEEDEPEGQDGETQVKDYWEPGSIVKVNDGPEKGEYKKIKSVNDDGTFELEDVDIEAEYEKARRGQ